MFPTGVLMRILLIEDDQLLGEGICSSLKYFSYTVDWLTQGKPALAVLTSQNSESFDLVILDLGLPDIDGIELLKKIRSSQNTVPVLVLTARDQIEDKLDGLNTGADDYMVKPFDVRELDARIKALVRRKSGNSSEQIVIGKTTLDCSARKLNCADKNFDLTRREYPIIRAFFENPDKIFSREKLESQSYGWSDEVESNALEVHIHNIRKKLGNNAIKTIRGVGYMLVSNSLG